MFLGWWGVFLSYFSFFSSHINVCSKISDTWGIFINVNFNIQYFFKISSLPCKRERRRTKFGKEKNIDLVLPYEKWKWKNTFSVVFGTLPSNFHSWMSNISQEIWPSLSIFAQREMYLWAPKVSPILAYITPTYTVCLHSKDVISIEKA